MGPVLEHTSFMLVGMIPYQYAPRCDKSAQTKEPLSIIHNPSVTHYWALCFEHTSPTLGGGTLSYESLQQYLTYYWGL